MPAAYYDLYVEQGATFKRTIRWLDKDDAPIDIVGYTARMQIRRTIKSEEVLVELTTENGRIVIESEPGEFSIIMPAELTAGFEFLRAVYDLEVESPEGVVDRLLKGCVYVDREVTR